MKSLQRSFGGAMLLLAASTGIKTVTTSTLADSFGTGTDIFTMDFVVVGDPGNAPEVPPSASTGLLVGGVNYEYRIGKYEVSREQVIKANSVGGLGLQLFDWGKPEASILNLPATGLSWNETARFVNWLNTSSGFAAAYKFASQPGEPGYNPNANLLPWQSGDLGFNPSNPYRNREAHYFLPSVDEWYKAGYYDGSAKRYNDYPTGSDTAPRAVAGGTEPDTAVYSGTHTSIFLPGPAEVHNAGGLSPYGTMAQGGNVFDWTETSIDMVNDSGADWRWLGGGFYQDNGYLLGGIGGFAQGPDSRIDTSIFGFRIAAVVPEPQVYATVMGMMVLGIGAWRRLTLDKGKSGGWSPMRH